ncbi:hypothetical protein F4781DRAFT_264543 [Annulohypoxylon bovei var. microspora]|nr:hypothetical protein F4781DRAFT_264543 [Annulohypoxylon bovei var. microspora]
MMVPRSFFYSRKQSISPTITASKVSTPKRKDDPSTKKDVTPIKPTNIRTPPRDLDMAKRKSLQSDKLSPSSSPPSTTMTNAVARPNTPSSAVQIPIKSRQDAAYSHRSRPHAHAQRKHFSPKRFHDAHSPDAIPPSVAALLAITSIPPPNRRMRSRQQSRDSSRDSRMTVDSIVSRSQVSEKALSQELSEEFARDLSDVSIASYDRSPMDVLLSPPDELDEDEASINSDGAFTSALSTRAASFESVPSLGDSFGTSFVASIDSPITPRGRRIRPPRRSLEPISSPPGKHLEHPLSTKSSTDVDQLDFRVFDSKSGPAEQKQTTGLSPLKSVFKSNLTASLRALRSAARSLSSFTASSIPPDDFLTRSILTIDPRVPFTDERMPPVMEEPSEAMRRYLNPTNNLRPDSRVRSPARSYTASIQMQTYKIQRSRSTPAANRSGNQTGNSKSPAAYVFPPGPRQREIRENSDFIRIAVLEHLMRKRGKLDDQREGHARWLLPPRKSTSKPYEIGADGIPARWVAISQNVI